MISKRHSFEIEPPMSFILALIKTKVCFRRGLMLFLSLLRWKYPKHLVLVRPVCQSLEPFVGRKSENLSTTDINGKYITFSKWEVLFGISSLVRLVIFSQVLMTKLRIQHKFLNKNLFYANFIKYFNKNTATLFKMWTLFTDLWLKSQWKKCKIKKGINATYQSTSLFNLVYVCCSKH